MICANCRKQYEDGSACCPHCGAPARMASSYPYPYPYPVEEKPAQKKGFWQRLFGKKD